MKELYHGGENEYCVFCFNPDTREETLIADFQIPHRTSSGDIFSSAFGVEIARSVFSSDYSKMADSIGFAANGEQHAGWQNTDGTFTDVTEILGQQSKGDFEDPVHYRGLGFAGENFGYIHSSNGSDLDFYVPVDNLSPGAVQEGDVRKVGHPYNENGALMKNGYFDRYYPNSVTSWIDETRAIVNLNHDSSLIFDTATQSELSYIPGNSRKNWNGVASPDGTKIAFMSKPKNGSDIDIYIVPISGGDPVKVEGHPYNLRGKDGPRNQNEACTLIDWI